MARAYFNAVLFSLVVVKDRGRYALVEERESAEETSWYLPAGGVHHGEDFAAAAIRETREESGLDVELLGILGMDQRISLDGSATKIRVVFLARPVGGSLKQQEDAESVRAKWFEPAEIAGLRLRSPEVTDWVDAAERHAGSTLPTFVAAGMM